MWSPDAFNVHGRVHASTEGLLDAAGPWGSVEQPGELEAEDEPVSPQRCVELPYGAAEMAWPYLTYGSLVTVSGSPYRADVTKP